MCVYGPSHGLSYGPGIQTHVSNRKQWVHFLHYTLSVLSILSILSIQ
jgi:hypothetical protein